MSLDNKIIQIARNQNGKISTLDLVTELHLSVDDSKKELEDLYLKGIFSVQVSNDGGVYYELNKSL